MNQIAERFELDIIYAFGSHAKEVAEWLEIETGVKKDEILKELKDEHR